MQIELERSEIVTIVVALRNACERWQNYYNQAGDPRDREVIKRYDLLVQRLEAKLNESHHPNNG
jgi:hypothetical protein